MYNGNIQKAEDLTSEVMLKVMNTIGKYSVENGSGYFRGWIKKVARNTFIDNTRTSKHKFNKKVVSIDIVELSPPFDRDCQTARLASSIAAEVIYSL